MRIAIDARELEGKPTGVGRYLANLLRCWLAGEGEEEFILYHRGPIEPRDWMSNPRLRLQQVEKGLLPFGVWWQQAALPRAMRADRPDVLFAPADSLPLRWRRPSLLTVHDLSYEAYPEWFGAVEGWRRCYFARRSAQKASAVVAISGFTADELTTRYGIRGDKVHIVHHGIDDSLRRAPFTPEEELRQRIGMEKPFVLMVGSLFERRFPLQVIRAFELLGDIDVGLVLAGDDRRREKTDLREDIRAAGLEDHVRWLEYCPEADLCGLYRSAEALIALSLYEGFSLPPLEAMSFGLPAIVSAHGAQLEVYGGSALTVEEESEENIATAIRAVLTDKTLRDDLIAKGTALASKLTLERSARATLDLIRSTAGGADV